MICYAVIDTNVIVSALLTKNADSATVKVVEAVLDGRIVPLYHSKILEEYNDVLCRGKFHFTESAIQKLIAYFVQFGVEVFPQPTGEVLADMDDLIFYEVVMAKRKDDAYLVTGNQKHFPVRPFVVTPAEMMDILEKD